ncbi:MAG TPA: heavy metal sensor histidine kinase [Pseudomonadales bacterium]|nr:heavy metal sensor histidine kinase [Pseudomonadales bacterium]
MRVSDSIVLRTSLLFSLLTAAVVLLMGIVVRVSVDDHFVDMDRAQLSGKFELIQHVLADKNVPADNVRIRQQLEDALVGHHDLVVHIHDANGNLVFSTGHAAIPNDVLTEKNAENAAKNIQRWTADGMVYRGMATDTETGYHIAVGINIHHHQEFLHAFEWQLLFIGGAGSLIMAILGWFAAKRGLRPVQEMAHIASHISAQQLQERLPINNIPVELLTLAESFNAMLDRLGDSLQRLSEFSSDLAHELRTPINNLMMQTQVSLSKPRDAATYRDILYANFDEYERLARMIADMLFLAKADHGLVIPHAEPVNLFHEATALCEFYEAVAAEKSVTCSVAGNAIIHGDKLMLQRALGNLFANAIRHSHQGSCIKIDIQMKNTQAIITIENHGDAIAPEQLPRVFDRFYRADASRQRNDDGTGLGLAITQSIIHAHGGYITAHCENGTTRFTITIPATTLQGNNG